MFVNVCCTLSDDGTDDDECSDTYGGPSAASEPETQAVQNYLKANGANMLAAISAHTYVAMWLHPYGHTDNQGNCVRSPDHDNQVTHVLSFCLFVCLCFTSHQRRGHLETAPPFTVPCEGREAR